MKRMCHGPGSLRRMNLYSTPEDEADNKENLETTNENTTVASEMEIIVKDDLEVVSKETRKNKA